MSSLKTLVFYATPQHRCSYLPDRLASTMFVDPRATIDLSLYSELSQMGFRRSGAHYYRPHCDGCRACVPVRIPVDAFRASRAHRRVAQRNEDLSVRIEKAAFTREYYALYERYIAARHRDGDMFPPTESQFVSFLVEGSQHTLFVEFRLAGRLIGLAVVDRLQHALSAVYTMYEPEFEDRSIGTYAVLWQIAECRRSGFPHLYLGYWINECRKMSYKTKFQPLEALEGSRWVPLHEKSRDILSTDATSL